MNSSGRDQPGAMIKTLSCNNEIKTNKESAGTICSGWVFSTGQGHHAQLSPVTEGNTLILGNHAKYTLLCLLLNTK